MTAQRFGVEPTVAQVYYQRLIQEEVVKWNREKLPLPFVRGCGRWVNWSHMLSNGKILTFKLPMKRLGTFSTVSRESAVSHNMVDVIDRQLVMMVRGARKEWAQPAKPRNYYLIDSAECVIKLGDWLTPNYMTVAFKLFFVILPKRWRSKVWRAEQLAKRKP